MGTLTLAGLFSVSALAASGITYHGRLLDQNSVPVTSSSVQFRLQIRTPGTEDCLMYEEIQTLDLSNTSGVFSLSLGDGSGVRQDLHAWGLFEALSNRQSFSFTAADCNGLSTYTPGPADNRKFRVSFNLGSGWESLPIQTINYIPMSIQTYAVGGFPASALFRVEDAGVVGNVAALTTTQYNNLVDLADGSSSVYEKSGSLNGSTLPSIGSGESVKWNGTSWESYSPLESGDETDPTVSAFAKTSLPTCAAGEVLKSDGSVLSCVTDTSGTLPDVGVAGTYTKVTTDAKGRVTSGTTLDEADLPSITTPGKVSGDAITSGEISGSTSINTSGSITTTGNLSVSGSATTGSFSTRLFDLYDSDNSNKISFLTPATGDLTSDYTLTLPVDAGTSGQVLSTDGSGALSWISPSTGSVTSVAGTSPIVITGTASAPVVTLSNSGVGAATYGSATEVPVFEVDEKGLIQSVTNTTISGVSPVGSDLSTGKAWIGDGTGKAAEAYINVSDLKKSDGTNQIPLTCTASQTLVYSAVTDLFSCSDIAIAHTQVSGLDAGNISNTPSGNITATDVQAALNELDSDISSLSTDLSSDISGKVSKSGDTMSGNLDMDGHQILNISNVPFSSVDPTGTEDGQTLRWNNTSGNWEWFLPGVAGSGITSINGESGNSQTFTFGTSGTAPAIVSASDTHTLNIPMASGTGVTAGLISKSDYDAFNSKLDAVTGSTLSDGKVFVGDASNQAQEVALSGDATLANDGTLTLKNTGTAGTYGSATEIPIITTDAQGRVTGVTESSVTIPQDASDITNTPAGSIAADDVQEAINELDSEKVAKAGDTMTGTLNLPSNGLTVGTDQLVVNGGSVGIGTTNPGRTLHVLGKAAIGSNQANVGVLFVRASGSTNNDGFVLGNSDFSASARWWIDSNKVQRIDNGVLADMDIALNAGGAGRVGIGTTSPSEKLEVVGKIKATELCIGNDCQSSWPSAGGGGTVTEVTGTAPIQVATGTSTPVISVDDATTSAKGVVLLADDDGSDTTAGHVVQASDSRLQDIAGKLANDLAQYKVFVGDASNKAAAQWFGVADLRTSTGAQQFSDANCTSSQTLTWSSLTDAFSCGDIAISASQISDLSTTLDDKVNVAGDAMTGALTMNAQNEVRFSDSDSSNYVGFKAPASITANKVWTLPNADGTSGQVLSTDGSGVLSWSTVSAGGSGDGHSLDSADGSVTDALFVENNGNVGIGTSGSSKLTVAGDLRITSGSYSRHILYANGNAILGYQAGTLMVGTNGGASKANIKGTGNTSATSALSVLNSDDDPLIFARDDGNVGIGTASPNSLLTVEGVTALKETTAPTATTDYGKIYVKSSDHKLYFMNASGTETELGASGGGGSSLVGTTDEYSTAYGYDATANFEDGVAIGHYSSAGKYSVSVGSGYEGSVGDYSVGVGFSSESDNSGTAVGINSFADNGTALGGDSFADTYGVAAGTFSNSGKYGAALGYQAGYVESFGATEGSGAVLLGYQAGYNSSTTLDLTNTFIVSNDDMEAKTPLLYGKFDTGYLGIGTTSPDTKLHIVGASGSTLKIVDGNQGAGKVLTSDANGVASWQAAPSGGASSAGAAGTIQLSDGSGGFAAPSGSINASDYTIYTDGLYGSFLYNGMAGTAIWADPLLIQPSGTGPGTSGYIALRATDDTNTVTLQAPDSLAANVKFVLPGTAGTNGQVLTTDGSGVLSWEDAASGGGSPGGSNKQIQFNNSGSFGGSSKLSWTDSSQVMQIGGSTGTGGISFGNGSKSLTFDGSDSTPLTLQNQSGAAKILSLGDLDLSTSSDITLYTDGALSDGNITLVSGSSGIIKMSAPGGDVVVDTAGNVGIGTTTPQSALEVNGAARNTASISNSTSTIDFSTGNIQYTAASCGAFDLHNVMDGGAYTFVVKGTTSATCSFTAYSDGGSTSLTVHLPPDHAATTAGKHTLYSLMVVGSDVYFSWVPGY